MITKTSYATDKNIMIAQDSYYVALGVVVSGTAGATLKAGEPLGGDITARDTAFTLDDETAVGILLHDVVLDSTGKGNGTLVIVGCVDLLKLDSSVVTNIETALEEGVLEKIIFVKGSAI